MFAPHGTPILAVESGSVEFYWNHVGGNSFRLYGDSGTFYYGTHLADYEGVSRGVEAGELIGYVGTTGNAAGTPPHLHFQIHPDGRGTPAVNPTPAVEMACETVD